MSLPNLRFPEFRDSPEWKTKQLKYICKMQAGKFVSASEIQEKAGVDLFPCFGGNGSRGFTKTYTHNGIYPLIGRQGALCGNINLATGQFHATEHAVVATPVNKVDVNWLFYELLKLNLNQYATGQAQPGLSVETLEKITISVPENEKEQQKIADCLSSIDKLITAQTQKLDTLKTHKKGLMQQLFPAEGETVPKLRFPEFRDGGEWELKSLGNYIEQYIEKTSAITDLPVFSSTREGLKPQKEYYDGQELINEGEYGVVPHGYFVYRHMSDDNIFKFNINNLSESIAVSKEYPVFKARKINADFLLQKLNHDHEFKRFAISQKKGGTRTRLYFSTLSIWQCLLPLAQEQKKIADCLASVDEMIAAQVQKVEALKQHKKGLMQQLFPAAEEVAG